MVVLACNPSACEAAARALPQVQGHCGLHNKFQTSQGYASPSLKNSAKKIISIHFTSSLLSSTRISDSSWVSALPPPCFSGPNSSSSVCTLQHALVSSCGDLFQRRFLFYLVKGDPLILRSLFRYRLRAEVNYESCAHQEREYTCMNWAANHGLPYF